MGLYETLQADYMSAFKERRTIEKEALNYLLAQIKNKKIELQKELEDNDIIQLIKKEIKSRKEWAGFLQQAGKEDEYSIEIQKAAVLEKYLPKMFSEEETKKLVLDAQKDLWIQDIKKERGKLIGHLMKSHGSALDGSLLNIVINNL